MKLKITSSSNKVYGTEFHLTIFEYTPLVDVSVIPYENFYKPVKKSKNSQKYYPHYIL